MLRESVADGAFRARPLRRRGPARREPALRVPADEQLHALSRRHPGGPGRAERRVLLPRRRHGPGPARGGVRGRGRRTRPRAGRWRRLGAPPRDPCGARRAAGMADGASVQKGAPSLALSAAASRRPRVQPRCAPRSRAPVARSLPAAGRGRRAEPAARRRWRSSPASDPDARAGLPSRRRAERQRASSIARPPSFGETLAAAPALAWAVALDWLAERAQRRARRAQLRPRRRARASSSWPRRRAMSRAAISGVGVVSAFGVGARRVLRRPRAGAGAVGPSAPSTPGRSRCASPARCPRLPASSTRRARSQARARARGGGGGLAQRPAAAAADRDAALVARLGLEQALLEDFAPLLDGGRIDWAAAGAASSPARRGARSARRSIGTLRALAEAARAAPAPRIVHVSACAAGALAVAHAAALDRARRAESWSSRAAPIRWSIPSGLGGMARLGAPSPRHAPDACRPFDRRARRPGDGRRRRAVRRRGTRRAPGRAARASTGARSLGWGSTQDAYRVTAPRPDGAAGARAPCSARSRAPARRRGDRLRQRARHRARRSTIRPRRARSASRSAQHADASRSARSRARSAT